MREQLIKSSWIYFLANVLIILPMIFINSANAEYYPGAYIILMIIYHVFKLTYLNIFLAGLLIIYSLITYFKEKKKSHILISFLLAAICIAANVYWLNAGYIWTVQ